MIAHTTVPVSDYAAAKNSSGYNYKKNKEFFGGQGGN
jgi:hypothetical protein